MALIPGQTGILFADGTQGNESIAGKYNKDNLFGNRADQNDMPQTLNIEDIAGRSRNFLTKALDFKDGMRPYFYTFYGKNPPELSHNVWDHCEDFGRFLYASIYSRIILGDKVEPEQEKAWKEHIYKSFAPGEHFSCRPIPDPYKPFRDSAVEQRDESDDVTTGFEVDSWDNRSVFTGLMLSYLSTGDEKCKDYCMEMLTELKRIVIRKGTWCYLSKYQYTSKYEPDINETPAAGENMMGWVSPLVFASKVFEDPELFEIARGFCQCFIDVTPDDHKDLPHREALGYNTHSFLFALAGIIRVGRQANLPKYIVFAKKHFDNITNDKELVASFGWIAEQFKSASLGKIPESCETCTLVDYMDTALQLAKAGWPEYFNIAEKVFRNYFYEAQVKDGSFVDNSSTLEDTFTSTFTNIGERIVGSFAGWGGVNDFVDPEARRLGAIQNCCAPHAVFGTYQIWNNIITAEKYNPRVRKGGIFVNLHLNRNNKYSTVMSYAPYEGKTEILLKTNASLFVVIPEDVKLSDVKVTVNNNPITVDLVASYLTIGEVAAHDKVVITYPIINKTIKEDVEHREYTTTWRAGTVVEISPKGTIVPLFMRDNMKADKAPTATISLHNSSETFDW